MEKTSDRNTSQKPSKKTAIIAAIIAMIVAIIVCIPLAKISIIEKEGGKEPYGEKTSWFTILTKEKPGIYASPSYDPNGNLAEFLGYEFEIKCHDDYKEVVIAVRFKDEKYNLVKTDYITFENCKEGKNYKQLYTFTTLEILTIKHVSYDLYEYK